MLGARCLEDFVPVWTCFVVLQGLHSTSSVDALCLCTINRGCDSERERNNPCLTHSQCRGAGEGLTQYGQGQWQLSKASEASDAEGASAADTV